MSLRVCIPNVPNDTLRDLPPRHGKEYRNSSSSIAGMNTVSRPRQNNKTLKETKRRTPTNDNNYLWTYNLRADDDLYRRTRELERSTKPKRTITGRWHEKSSCNFSKKKVKPKFELNATNNNVYRAAVQIIDDRPRKNDNEKVQLTQYHRTVNHATNLYQDSWFRESSSR